MTMLKLLVGGDKKMKVSIQDLLNYFSLAIYLVVLIKGATSLDTQTL